MACKHRYQIIPILELHPQLDTSPTTNVWICMLGLYRLVTPKHAPKVACRITQGHVIEYSTVLTVQNTSVLLMAIWKNFKPKNGPIQPIGPLEYQKFFNY